IASRERHEREVRRIEHELHAHEDHDGVPADQYPSATDEEEDSGYEDVRAQRDHRRSRRRVSAPSASSRLVSTIAPTIAARSRTAIPAMQRKVKAISNAAAVMRLMRTTAAPAAITPTESIAKTIGSTKSKVIGP